MRLLLLVRHAVTEHTGARLSGWTPGLHLSEAGREQAGGLAERLGAGAVGAGDPSPPGGGRGAGGRSERLGPVRVDAVYASPLERCQETAAAVADAKGLKVGTLEDLGEV